jgi:transcriptional regulator with XRE-family HTH domain
MVENLVLNVGSRLRSIREQQGLSLRAVAQRCGLSINAISQIERGTSSPTVFTLQRLASALDVPITDFFLDEGRQMVVMVKRGQGMRARGDGILMESLGSGLFDQRLEPFRMRIEPGVENLGDPVSHPGEEFVHCIEGRLEYYIGGSHYQLEQGDSLLFDATQEHAYRNPWSKAATILVIFQTSSSRQQVQKVHLEG